MAISTLMDTGEESYENPNSDYHVLNAKLNLYDVSDLTQFDIDRAMTRQYFPQRVNKNAVYLHDLEEKTEYLVKKGYCEKEVLDQYPFDFVKSLYKTTHAKKSHFPTFPGTFKHYTPCTLKAFDGTRYLKRYEDHVCMVTLTLTCDGQNLTVGLMEEIISGRFQPATPVFLNAGKAAHDELISCFFLRIEDNMEPIACDIDSAPQLSKRGGGVALDLLNLYRLGAPIKRIQNQSSGINPVTKFLEDSLPYASQLGTCQDVGAVYLHTRHPDIPHFFDTRRENMDEKTRIKTLSLGIVIPGVTFEPVRSSEDMYLLSPCSVEHVYGVPLTEIPVSEKCHEMVDDKRIRKSKINARVFFQTLSKIQLESGYPYIIFKDAVNAANPTKDKITMPNLYSGIFQVSEAPEHSPDLPYMHVGGDISCNLKSMSIAKAMDSPDLDKTVEVTVHALTTVSGITGTRSIPSIECGNVMSHPIDLGQMDPRGCLGHERAFYGSGKGLDFMNIYLYTALFHVIRVSMEIAREYGGRFAGFEDSTYATGEFFDKYAEGAWEPTTSEMRELFVGVHVPTSGDWAALRENVRRYGMYNQNLQAVPSIGSISCINYSMLSIHPTVSKIRIRGEGKIGRVCYPAPYMTNDNPEYYQDAYETGSEEIIDTYAATTQHVGQGLSLTLFYPDIVTMHDVNRNYIYVWCKDIKTLYYIRIRQQALKGTEVTGCVSCIL